MSPDDRRYLTWEERAKDDARYRPGGKYAKKPKKEKESNKCLMCGGSGKFIEQRASGAKVSMTCPSCNGSGKRHRFY